MVLAQLALAPVDLDGVYVVDQEGYRDQDGNASRQPTSQYVRALRANGQTTLDLPASRIIVSINDLGESDAKEFIDAAADEDVGPPDLSDYVQQQISGAHDAHAELLNDFPSYDDDTVANRLTWQQPSDGEDQTWRSYSVYVRSGGLLVLVAVRAPMDAEGSEPEGLLKQALTVTKKQADKLKGMQALLSPRQ